MEGDIAEVDGVLRITEMRLHYRLRTDPANADKVQRALDSYADKCPAYMSVRECIPCHWDLEIVSETS